MYHADAAVPAGEGIAKLPAAIRRAVIDQQDLDISVGLAQNTVDTVLQIFDNVIDRDNHRNQRFHHNLLGQHLLPRPAASFFLWR